LKGMLTTGKAKQFLSGITNIVPLYYSKHFFLQRSKI